MAKVKVERAATDVSPKVSVPALLILVAAVISAVTSGEWNTPESVAAIVALVEAVVGYFTADKVEV